jgi:hypothetical protein
MIRVVHPGAQIRMLTFSHPGSRIQGSKRHPIPDPGSGSATLERTPLIFLFLDIGKTKKNFWKFVCRALTSVSDPDPDWIQIGSGFNQVRGSVSPYPYPDSESGSGSRRAKMTHKSRKIKKFHVLKCWMFSFEG